MLYLCCLYGGCLRQSEMVSGSCHICPQILLKVDCCRSEFWTSNLWYLISSSHTVYWCWSLGLVWCLFEQLTHICVFCGYKIAHSFACQPFTRAARLLEADTQHIDEREKLGVSVDQLCVTSWPSGVSQLWQACSSGIATTLQAMTVDAIHTDSTSNTHSDTLSRDHTHNVVVLVVVHYYVTNLLCT